MAIVVITSQNQRDRLGAAVAQARAYVDLSQQQLADAAGLKRGQVARLEHGLAAPAHVLRAVLAVLEQHRAEGLDVLRQAVGALPAPVYRPAVYDQTWAHDWPAIRLKVTVPGGLAFPGGQAAEGAVIRVKTSRARAAQWINAVDQGWVEPVADEDRDAVILMRRKLEDPGVALVIEGRPGRSNAEAGKWHRLGAISPDMDGY